MCEGLVETKKHSASKGPGVLLLVVGLGLTLLMALRLYGQAELWSSSSTARCEITNTKRAGGLMSINYRFRVNGNTYSGRDSVGVDYWEAVGIENKVKYLPQYPIFNCLSRNETMGNMAVSFLLTLGGMAMMTVGVVLIRLKVQKSVSKENDDGEIQK